MSLVAERLVVHYGGATNALDGVSGAFVPGSFAALVGPNGSGKSTLLRCLAGSLPPSEGVVLLDGDDVRRLRPGAVARRLAFVPQNNPVGFAFTVRELAELGAGGNAARVEPALAALDLAPLAGRSLLTLSGGEQQRAAIARALAQDTPYLLLDEPTAHLDLRHQTQVLGLLGRLARQKGRAVLVVLHDLNLAAVHADRLVLLHQGRVAAEGSPEQVLTSARLADVYQTDVYIGQHPVTGKPWVLPKAAEDDRQGAAGAGGPENLTPA